jgi:hypothetical protein
MLCACPCLGENHGELLHSNLEQLDAVAHGALDNECWHDDYKSNDEASWSKAVERALAMDVNNMNRTAAAVQKCLSDLALVTERFGVGVPPNHAHVMDVAKNTLIRKEISQIEGTILWVIKEHGENKLVCRSKLSAQQTKLRKLEKWDVLIHAKVKAILQDGLKFK